ncbi:MAG TPA: hypothetical protein PKB14_03740 [Rubrivivax sp.]|nr:hypothetical protein [Rubrivivax sp.]
MSHRPADIVSDTRSSMLAPRTALDDALRAGRKGYDKPTPQNSIMLFIAWSSARGAGT